MSMTDAELGKELGFTEAEALIAVPKLSPAQRATYEKMITFGREWNLYAAGVGPRPTTPALVDTERAVNRRKGWRRAGWVEPKP
jgi:hypothetical protein